MIVADRDGDRIVFMAGPRYKEMMKLIPGVRYHAQSKNWYAPLSWATCLSARGVLGEMLGVGDELAAWSWTYKAHLDDVAAVKQFPAGLVNDERLYPFQIPGAEFLLTAERAILADEMGTGKTVQTIAAVASMPEDRLVLIVCTNSMKFTWAEEVKTWDPGAEVVVIHGPAAKRKKNFIDLRKIVACRQSPPATPNESTKPSASVVPATRRTTEQRTPTSWNEDEKPLELGTNETPNDGGRCAGAIETAVVSGETVSSTSTESLLSSTTRSLQNKEASAPSAGPLPSDDGSTLTTTTQPAPSEDFSVRSATAPSLPPTETTRGSNGPRHIYVVINWEAIRLHSRLASYGSVRLTDKEKAPGDLNEFPWDVVVCDEAHRLQDPKTKQTRAAWQIAHSARYRWMLTGTPIANSPEDLWSVGHAIAPEDFPRRSSYVDRFCLSGMNVWGGLEVYGLDPQTAPELFGFLDPRFFRRTKAEVLADLPPKTYSTRYVEMELKQRKSYDEFNKRMVAELDSGILLATDPLVKVGRLIQLAAATPELDDAGDVKALADPSCKVDALVDLLDEAPGEPVVVFAASRKLIELAARRLEKAKVSHVLITGAVEPAERSRNVEEFQDGKAQVCLATLGAGGEGITLTAASKVIFLQRAWSQVQNVQAEDRVHRISQVRPVEIIDVITKDTIEDAVHASGALKSSRLQEIVRDPHWLNRNLKQQGTSR